MTKQVTSTRLEPEMIAIARDGLIAKGYEKNQLITISNVVRLTFLHGLATMINLPQGVKAQPSAESLIWIQQKTSKIEPKRSLTLNDLRQTR